MSDPVAVAAALAEEPGSPRARDAFRALDDPGRRTALGELKRRVDETVRVRPPDAPPIAEELVALSAPFPDLAPLALRGRAVAAHFNGDNRAARGDFERAIELYEAVGEVVEAAVVHMSLVEVCHQLGEAVPALGHAEAAREAFLLHGETRYLAQLECNVGNVLLRQDEYPRAAERYRTARAHFERLDDPVGAAFCDFNLGVVLVNANELEEAEQRFVSAREGMRTAGHLLHVADADYHLSWLASRRGDHGAAIEGLERAREAFEENGKPSGPALCDLDLAEIHLLLDARRDALAHAERAMRRFGELGLEYELARSEVFAAMAQARLGEPEAALEILARAADRFEQLGNDASRQAVEVQRAALELEAGRTSEARARAESARAVVEERGLALLADLAALVAGRAALADGDADAARAAADGLLDASREGRALQGVVRAEALALRGRARLAASDLEGARADLEEACSAVDATWSALPRSDLRAAFFREHHAAFVDLAWLLSGDGGDASGALATLERGRERGLLEAPPPPPEEDTELRAARARLEVLQTRRLEAELSAVGSARELRVLPPGDEELFAAQRAVAELARRGRPGGPAGDPARGVAELCRAACPGEAVVCYLVGRHGVRALVVADETVIARDLSATPGELRRLVARLWFHLEKHRHGGAYLTRSDARRAAALEAPLGELGELLLAPIADLIADRPLVLVPHGPLHDLPFHAFLLSGEVLGERCEVAYAHSLAALLRARTGGAARASGKSMGGAITFATGNSTGREALPATEAEAAVLRRHFGEEVALESAGTAREALLRAASREGGILHVASHGLFEPLHPAFSSVRLGAGFLFAHDVQRMRLPLSLVTLAGCETGRHRRLAGEDHLGLVRAFLDAGARAVLGTLWPVADEDAAAFAEAFYSRLAVGEPARLAVAGAQRELRCNRPNPLSWAPFALHGDPDARFPAASPVLP